MEPGEFALELLDVAEKLVKSFRDFLDAPVALKEVSEDLCRFRMSAKAAQQSTKLLGGKALTEEMKNDSKRFNELVRQVTGELEIMKNSYFPDSHMSFRERLTRNLMRSSNPICVARDLNQARDTLNGIERTLRRINNALSTLRTNDEVRKGLKSQSLPLINLRS